MFCGASAGASLNVNVTTNRRLNLITANEMARRISIVSVIGAAGGRESFTLSVFNRTDRSFTPAEGN